MKTLIKKLALAAVAGAFLAPAAQATTTRIVFVGGNATQKIIQDRVTNSVLNAGSTYSVNSTNSTIFSYVGTLASDSSSVELDFNLTGGAGAIIDLTNATPTQVVVADNSLQYPTAAVSITGPGTIGVPKVGFFYEIPTLAAPVVFVTDTNNGLASSLVGVSNLSGFQAAFLETASGVQGPYTLPTSAVGGTSTTAPVYFVGRNPIAAVRQVTDANIGFANLFPISSVVNWEVVGGTPTTWPGAANGPGVTNILNVLSNSVGTLAVGDLNPSLTVLSYQGVPFSTNNVQNGSYTIWGVERYLYKQTGTYAPGAEQLTIIDNLVSAVTDQTYESTSSLFVGKYVQLRDLNTAGTSRDLNYDGEGIITAPYGIAYSYSAVAY